jgi:hypothetical protein
VTPLACAAAVEAFDAFFVWVEATGRGFAVFFTIGAGAGSMTGDRCRNTVGEGIWTSIRCGDEEASRQLLALSPG